MKWRGFPQSTNLQDVRVYPTTQQPVNYQKTPSTFDPRFKASMDQTAGMFQGVENFFDLPASMARDVVAWQNPFDQVLSPFQSRNRTSIRDLYMKAAGIQQPYAAGVKVGAPSMRNRTPE
jgi:hypothetical protein